MLIGWFLWIAFNPLDISIPVAQIVLFCICVLAMTYLYCFCFSCMHFVVELDICSIHQGFGEDFLIASSRVIGWRFFTGRWVFFGFGSGSYTPVPSSTSLLLVSYIPFSILLIFWWTSSGTYLISSTVCCLFLVICYWPIPHLLLSHIWLLSFYSTSWVEFALPFLKRILKCVSNIFWISCGCNAHHFCSPCTNWTLWCLVYRTFAALIIFVFYLLYSLFLQLSLLQVSLLRLWFCD